jgi:ubiquinol-cytochrome c reductase cytochrome b subunit
MFALVAVHLYLIVRHGISEPPRAGHPVDRGTYRQWYERLLHEDGVPFWPDAAWRDVIFALAVGSVVLLLSIVVGPPELGEQADPTIIAADPRPDWYFLWYFAVLALIPPATESWVIIGFPALIGLLLIVLPFVAPAGERSPRRRPWAPAIVGSIVVAIAVLVRLGHDAPWSPVMDPGPLPGPVTAGLAADQLRGVQLFQAKDCNSCHMVDGRGGRRGPDLSAVGARLSHDELVWRVLNGGTNMPAYGSTLKPDELDALVAFLETRK